MGLLVQQVADNSPAARLGLQPGEIKSQIGLNEVFLGGDIILEVVGIKRFRSGSSICRVIPFAGMKARMYSKQRFRAVTMSRLLHMRRVASRKKTFSSTFIVFSSFRLSFWV
jgi:hypothetical protein